MDISLKLNGVPGPTAEAQLRDHLAECGRKGAFDHLLLGLGHPVDPARFSPALCARLGLDSCLHESGPVENRRTLWLRGMEPIRFHSDARPGSARIGLVPDESRNIQEATAWLAHLALMRFHFRRPASSHDALAAEDALMRANTGAGPARSPLAFGEPEIQAAARIPYHERVATESLRDALALLHTVAAPSTLTGAWREPLSSLFPEDTQ